MIRSINQWIDWIYHSCKTRLVHSDEDSSSR